MLSEILGLFSQSFNEVLPQVLWAILLFLIGLFISKWIGRLVTKFLNRARLNQALKRLNWEEALSKVNIRLNAPKFFGGIVKWFFIILFLMASVEILGMVQFSQFLEKVITYFLNIFIAIIIFIITVFLADFSQKIVIGSLKKEKITYSRVLGKSIAWTVWILAVLAILYQLKIVPTLILSLFIGVIALVVITVGIAFGLGGKDLAARILKELEDKIR